MRRVTFEHLIKELSNQPYQSQYDHILSLIEKGRIKPVLASGKNGRKPALYREYWILETDEERQRKAERWKAFKEELEYGLSPSIQIDYYRAHPDIYEAERPWVLMMDRYLKEKREKLHLTESMNERSFEIWGREKFLKEEQGKRVCRHMGISLEMLNLYETTEPLAYYSHTKSVPQNLLIIENKDTFYTMRRHLLGGGKTILGLETGTLIYGAGKQILRSFFDFSLCMEPYVNYAENKIYYFGDLDYEGIGIYEDLCQRFRNEREIIPFKEAYLAMMDKVEADYPLEGLPDTKEKQRQSDGVEFYKWFDVENRERMKVILESGKYIPQEILTTGEL